MDRTRRILLSEQLPQEKAHWLEKLGGDLALSGVPLDHKRTDGLSEKKTVAIDLDAQSAGKLFKATNQNEFLIFTILVTVLKICLSKYNGVEDVIVGTAVHERNKEDALLNKVLVLRDRVSGEATFKQLLQDAKNTIYEAFSHQKFPFESILELLHVSAPEDRAPLFNVVVLLDNFQNRENISDLKNDVTVIFSIKDGHLTGVIEYSSNLFNERTLKSFARHYDNVLRAIVANPDQKISAIELLSQAEKQELIFGFNNTERDYPRQKLIQQLFEEQVERTPEATALVSEAESLSYRELNERANQVAGYLRELGVGPEVLVGVMLERSVEMVVGLLGVLKAGGAYVPLDVQYPAERIRYMLKDTGAPVLLTQQRLVEQLPEHEARVVCLDSKWGEISRQRKTNPGALGTADNLAYVIYTSGSTGKPKGVSVPHRAVVRLVKETNYAEFKADETFLQLAPLAFDASIFEIWGCLLNGARLVMMPPRQPSLTELGEALKRYNVTTLWLTAGLFHLMVDERLADLTSLRQLLAGGDVLSVPHVQKFLREAKDCILINGYGPTENTTFSCCYRMRNGEHFEYSVPIGVPISHTQAYVLDERLQPVPIGVTGELYIGGDGLARGYFHDPQLTAERFIPHPFSNESGLRLYRSGDLVRRLANGVLEFVGRRDQQVKIRGFRIEPGEIAAVLGQCEAVRECAVVVRPDVNGEKRLVAYVVPDAGQLSHAELQKYLSKKLPEYMLPAVFVMLDSLPLTANGKVDRYALPEPENVRPELDEGYVEPRTEMEALLVPIWQNLLRTEHVGVYDSFFDLGGHSLLATRLVMQVQQVFGVELPLWRIFEKPTVADMAEALTEAIRTGDKLPPIEAIQRPERIPLSPAQQRLWFLDSLLPGTALYNVYTAFQLEGELNLSALERSLDEVINRHEILRTIFPALHGQPLQRIEEAQPLNLRREDLSEMPDAEREGELLRLIREETLRPFDLEHGPLVRATLLKQAEQDHVLLLTMHHIISDGWSLEVLTRELTALYEAYSERQPAALEELPLQYADYAVWQRQWLEGAVLERQLQYWQQQLAGAPPVLELATDKPRPSVQSHHGATLQFGVSEPVSRRLSELCRGEGVTLFMGLLAAFNVLLSRYSGQQEILVGTPIANRTRAELETLIGFFSNTLVIRTNLAGGPSFRELLRRVREVCLGAYAHQDVPFERLVEELSPERDLSRTPLFQVLFSLHNVKTNLPEISGLALKPLRVDTGTSKVDLSFYLTETETELKGAIEYSTELFAAETIQRMSRHFHVLLEELLAHPDREVAELSMLTFAEEQQLLWEWNETAREYPQERSIQQLFEEQVARTPEATALVSEAESLSYRELNERANQVAGYLRELGVGPEVLVGVMLERSVEMVVGLLGVLKAGGAYVPLDVQYPAERIGYMLKDTGAPVLLTQQRLVGQLPEHEARVVCLDSEWGEISRQRKTNPEALGTADNLAYVIYTSGSTGKPKGVAIQHRSTITFLHWALEVFTLQQLAGVLASTSICFDLSIFEMFAPLSQGGTVILSENILALPSLRAAKQVTLINTVPSGIAELVRMKGIPPSVRTINLAGEALKDALVQEIYKQQTVDQVLNLYGPSEDTTYSTYTLVKKGLDEHVTIGRPVANSQVYVLDANQRPVPQGVPGELYLGGEGLARGYLNRPELTAERFVPNPFGRQPGARLYRTGDLVRYLPDGNIEYLGRADHQVKLRGYRIELGEIEALLTTIAAVREVVVVIKEESDTDKRLIAYVVAEEGHTLYDSYLREHLKEKLPQYMVPAAFVMMDALPLTPNGKVNRAALPEPEIGRRGLTTPFIMPRTDAEAAISAIWQEVLQLDHVGMDDNFFDLGGHSLLLVQVHFRLQELFDRSLTVIDLFQYPTISALAKFLSGSESEAQPVEPLSTELSTEAARPEHSTADRENAIAIIGMAGRFPGSSTLDQFWENLKNGVESIQSFADYELESSDVEPAALKDPNYIKAGAFLDGIDLFDAPFFDFNPREAEITDPQQRLFLECAWEALEQAGYASENGGRVGVFAGAGLSGYLQNLYANPEVMRSTNAFQIVIGNDKDYLSTRVSYKLNLKGPSLTVQTACSTSLVAVHIACQSLLNRECEIALAGGISIRVPQKIGYYYQEGGINSPDGHCRAFDANAQGTVPGNGGGVVVLKRLADALADGDNIQAVILGSAINNDGSGKVGYTAPSVDGQAEVVAKAQRVAGIEPQTVTYIEAHGTGTPLGDPIELAALSQAYRSETAKKNFCAIGSLKTNMGHLDAGAGVAGLIKTVLALNHQMIPPSLHFEQANPSSNLNDSPFYINSTLREWTTEDMPRRAGVSSFGIGGTNAHVILEEPPQARTHTTPSGPHLLLLSAKTNSALDTMSVSLRDYLQQHDDLDLRDLAYTLQVGRRSFNHRRMLVCQDVDDCIAQLSKPQPNQVLTSVVEPRHRPVVFMYPGQGSQHVRMGWSLYKSSAVFRREVDRCAQLLIPHLGLDLRSILYPRDAELESSKSQLNQTSISQPALFVIEYALTQLWLEMGLKPEATIGHSIGEYVSACVAGVFSLEDALKLVAARGRLMNGQPKGSMLMVPLPEQEVRQLLTSELSIAAINGPSLTVVSGPTEAIDEFERKLAKEGIDGRRLRTSHAFHSKMMEPIVSKFIEVVKGIALSPPRIPYVSNLTGTWITASQATDPIYWGNHLRQTVRFAEGVRELLKDQNTIGLEVGPGKGLSSLARQEFQTRVGPVALSTLGSANNSESDETHFLNTSGSLWLAGVRLNWSNLYGHEQPHRVALPTYPFERKRYWIESPKRAARAQQLPTVTVERPDAYIQNGAARRETVQQIVAQQLQISTRQLDLMSQQLTLLRSRSGPKTNGSNGKPNQIHN